MNPPPRECWIGIDPRGVCRNPFATRYVACARLDARDDRGARRDVGALASRVVSLGGGGAIVGPHGSGKTTLLEQLADRLETSAGRVVRVRLRGHGDGRAALVAISGAPRGTVVCIDGWERLGRTGAVVSIAARWRGVRLIVTSHRHGRLATLVECTTSVALLEALVAELPGYREWFGRDIARSDLETSFRASGGDLRTAMNILYDLFERRVRVPAYAP